MSGAKFTLSLYAARVNMGLSRKQVEEETGIPVALIGKYEREQAEPRASDVQKLCLLYRVGIEDLRFRGTPPEKRKR